MKSADRSQLRRGILNYYVFSLTHLMCHHLRRQAQITIAMLGFFQFQDILQMLIYGVKETIQNY